MASNRTTDKTHEADTKTEAKPFSFARLFNRNGHEKKPLPPPVQPQGPPKTVWRDYFESAVVTVIMALFGMTFIVQAVKVPTGSMQNTITIGDHLLVNKFIFAPGKSLPFLPQREIRRGDIIVFKYPGNPDDPIGDSRPDNRPIFTNFVKRVIGLPGDRVRIEGTDVIINDQIIPEHKIVSVDPAEAEELRQRDAPLIVPENWPARQPEELYDVYYRARHPILKDKKFVGGFEMEPMPEGDQFKGRSEIVVPPGSYFVMGDNRHNSQDSRYWGFVPRDLVIGRAMFVYWSYDESAEPTRWGFLADFIVNTRWSRTGTLVK